MQVMNSIKEFLKSNLFNGIPIYPLKKEKPWYGFMYIAKYVDNTRFKIGYTNYDIKRRGKELARDEFNTPMYVWASPNPQMLEKYVKQTLVYFTKPEGKYSDEIFYNIPLQTLVNVVRLIVLYTVVKENWIADPNNFYYEALFPYFGGPPFNVIVDGNMYKADVVVSSNFTSGTRVKVLWEGEWVEGKIEGKRVRNLKNFEDKVIGDGFKIRFDNGKYYEFVEDKIKPIYERIDKDRILDLEEAYNACKLNIITLKF